MHSEKHSFQMGEINNLLSLFQDKDLSLHVNIGSAC